MNAYRFNQIAMAVLGALLLFFGAKTIINIAFEEHEEKPGYDVPGTEAGKPEGEKPAGGSDLATLLAKGNEAHGADVAKKCGLCHNFEKGGPNMIGPDLYGVLGRKIASHEGYEYSDALKAKGGNWDYELINHMIENPNAYRARNQDGDLPRPARRPGARRRSPLPAHQERQPAASA